MVVDAPATGCMLWMGGLTEHSSRTLMRTLAAIAVATALLQAVPLSAQAPSAAGVASPSHRAAAARLLEVTRERATLEQAPDASVPAPLQGMAPGMEAMQPLIREVMREHLTWATLEPEFVRIYTEVFTERELRELTAFYETPLGQKLLDKMPVASARKQTVVMERMQRGMPKLLERLQSDMLSRGMPSMRDTTRKP
jgi:uncharacterized protein